MTTTTTTTTVNYSIPPKDDARAYVMITGSRDTNVTFDERQVRIEDVRGDEHLYHLDNTGFQFFNRPCTKINFRDDKQVQEVYYPESINLIKEITGASRVVLFDHTHRLRRPGEVDNSPEKRQPVSQAHVDQTTASSIARVHRHLPPEDVPDLLRRRFQIINLWRPIGNPAFDWPLALCDYQSVDPETDTFPVALILPDREGETMGVKYNPNHQWKYVRGMTPDEFVLIKCFDSVQDGNVAVFTPHTAFDDPSTPKDSPLRESIELRALVFYD